MQKAKNIIQLVTSVLGLVTLSVTITGQYRRHRTHEKHSQQCPCLTGCSPCTFDAARGM